MKYEVGERVMVRLDLHKGDDYIICVSSDMESYRGKEGIITECNNLKDDTFMYTIKFDGEDEDSLWRWTDDMFVPISSLPSVGVRCYYKLTITTETKLGVVKSWTAIVTSSSDVTDIINGIQVYGSFKTVKYEIDELEADKPSDVINAVCGICISYKNC